MGSVCAVGFEIPVPPPTGAMVPVSSNFSFPPDGFDGAMTPPIELAVEVWKFSVVWLEFETALV